MEAFEDNQIQNMTIVENIFLFLINKIDNLVYKDYVKPHVTEVI